MNEELRFTKWEVLQILWEIQRIATTCENFFRHVNGSQFCQGYYKSDFREVRKCLMFFQKVCKNENKDYVAIKNLRKSIIRVEKAVETLNELARSFSWASECLKRESDLVKNSLNIEE